MRSPERGLKLMVSRPAIDLTLTRRLGVRTSSFMSASRSVPPASSSTSPQLLPRRPTACCVDLGVAYSKARISRYLLGRKAQGAGRKAGNAKSLDSDARRVLARDDIHSRGR